jgi:hypothetical protein
VRAPHCQCLFACYRLARENTVKVINTVTATITDPNNYTVGEGYGLVVV